MREGRDPLALSRGCSFEKLVPDEAGRSFADFCFRRRGAWGAPLPYSPSGDGMREGSHPLVRSRGLVWRGIGFPLVREAVPVGISFLMNGVGASVLVGVWFSTARGVGRSAPLHPLGDGVREGCDPLALSRGLFF